MSFSEVLLEPPEHYSKGVPRHMFSGQDEIGLGVYSHGLVPESQRKSLFMLTIQKQLCHSLYDLITGHHRSRV